MIQVKPHILKACYWNNDIDDKGSLRIGQSFTQHYRFPEMRGLAGFELEFYRRFWWIKVFPKHIRISVTEGMQPVEWKVVYEDTDLPQSDKTVIMFDEYILTRYVKVEWFEHHGPSGFHMEIAGNPKVSLFDCLENFRWIFSDDPEPDDTCTVPDSRSKYQKPYTPVASDLELLPLPNGVEVEVTTNELIYTTSWLKIGFSRLRPLITYLGWDSELTGRQGNLLFTKHKTSLEPSNGPWLSTIQEDVPAGYLSGRMSVRGNVVSYEHVEYAHFGLTLNIEFTILNDSVEVVIEQNAEKMLKVLEYEALRWIWNTSEAITATLAKPSMVGRTGRCSFPAILHAPNRGNMSLELLEGDPDTCWLKADSFRDESIAWTGIEIGITVADDGDLWILPGRTRAKIRMTPASLKLSSDNSDGSADLHPSFRRAWGSVFGFRPEYYGMSNNASSLNCHFVQHVYADMAYFTEASVGFDVIELCAYSVQTALAGGLGYGDNRDYFLDTDASLLMAAGTCFSKTRDMSWLRHNWRNLLRCGKRLLDKRADKGLIVCPKQTGNSREWTWSSNWWDVIGFGHLDAFSNAYVYRGFRHMQEMAAAMGDETIVALYREAADDIQSSFFECFYNPESGWLGGWRSRDGQLHDYAFLFINGIAIVYGLVPKEHIRPILERLENKREEVGFNHFHLGLPGNLIPIPKSDYVHGPEYFVNEDGSDAYGVYQNGGATMNQAYYYLRALGMSGIPSAEVIGTAILESFEHDDVIGGIHEGNEWRSWDGRKNGYEGLLSDQIYVLLAIAQNQHLAGDIRWPGSK